ncbi:MAG: cation transporter, partial [Hyphomicrobiales bacterium]
ILLEGTPEWLDVDALRADLESHVPAVEDVHHVHAWMLTQERVLMTLHVAVANGAETGPVLEAVQEYLRETYGVDHATIQIEPTGNAGCHDRIAG